MWWDVSAIACALIALALRWWNEPRAAALTSYLSIVCSAWGTYRKRWIRRAESQADGE